MKKILVISIIFLFFYTSAESRPKYVILKKGETLWRISRKYNVSLNTLKKINKIRNISKVYAGTKIYLSSPYMNTTKNYLLNIKLKN